MTGQGVSYTENRHLISKARKSNGEISANNSYKALNTQYAGFYEIADSSKKSRVPSTKLHTTS